MDFKSINVKDSFKLKKVVYIDTRSKKEFLESSIYNAINIPIFNDSERSEIGYIYKQVNKEDAFEKGLETASNKLPNFYKILKPYSDKGFKIVVFCAKGGMRSRTIATTMSLMNIDIYQLEGGYKAYRNYIIEYFKKDYNNKFIVLKGGTGTGKTKILRELVKKDVPVMDLELSANHRGSVFGGVGLGKQNSQKHFESYIFYILNKYKNNRIFIESESRKIGNLTVPNNILEGIKNGIQIKIDTTIDNRTSIIIEDYTNVVGLNNKIFINKLEILKRYLASDIYDQILSSLNQNDFFTAVKLLLIHYYDPLYNKWNVNLNFDYIVNGDDIEKTVLELKNIYKNIKKTA